MEIGVSYPDKVEYQKTDRIFTDYPIDCCRGRSHLVLGSSVNSTYSGRGEV